VGRQLQQLLQVQATQQQLAAVSDILQQQQHEMPAGAAAMAEPATVLQQLVAALQDPAAAANLPGSLIALGSRVLAQLPVAAAMRNAATWQVPVISSWWVARSACVGAASVHASAASSAWRQHGRNTSMFASGGAAEQLSLQPASAKCGCTDVSTAQRRKCACQVV
jgi:hypothetical protein